MSVDSTGTQSKIIVYYTLDIKNDLNVTYNLTTTIDYKLTNSFRETQQMICGLTPGLSQLLLNSYISYNSTDT